MPISQPIGQHQFDVADFHSNNNTEAQYTHGTMDLMDRERMNIMAATDNKSNQIACAEKWNSAIATIFGATNEMGNSFLRIFRHCF